MTAWRRSGRTVASPKASCQGATASYPSSIKHLSEAYRLVHPVQIDTDIWVLHAFHKKSKAGIKTPKADIDLIEERLKRLREMPR